MKVLFKKNTLLTNNITENCNTIAFGYKFGIYSYLRILNSLHSTYSKKL